MDDLINFFAKGEKKKIVDQQSYSILISGFGKRKLYNKMELIFEIAVKKYGKEKLSYYIYESIMEIYAVTYQSNKALFYLEDLLIMNKKPRNRISNLIIHGLCKENNCEEAFKTFYKLLKEDVKFSYSTCIDLMNCLCKNGELQNLEKIFQALTKNSDIQNIEIAYSIFIDALQRKGLIEKALDIYQQCIKNNVKPNEYIFSHLINGIRFSKRIDLLPNLLLEIKKYFPTLSSDLYSLIIRAYIENNQLEKALQLLEEIEDKILTPRVCNAYVSTITINNEQLQNKLTKLNQWYIIKMNNRIKYLSEKEIKNFKEVINDVKKILEK